MTTVFHAALKRSCGQEKSKSPYTFYPSIPSDLIPLRVSAGGGANLSLEEAGCYACFYVVVRNMNYSYTGMRVSGLGRIRV